MNDKQQLAAMGAELRLTEEQAKGLAERMPQTGMLQILDDQPMCMANRIEELEAQVRVMGGALNELREFAAANVWDDDERGALLSSIDDALAGKMSGPAMPEGWKLVEKANCFVLTHDGQVIASMAGPTAENTALILASVLAGNSPYHAAPEGWQLVPVEPTDHMTWVGQSMRYDSEISIGSIYCAMLAATPKLEVK